MSSHPLVLITGGNGELGQHVVQQLAQSGKYEVLLACRSVSKGEKVRADVTSGDAPAASRVHVIELDIQSDESIDKAVAEIQSEYGRLDILINNAAIMTPAIQTATMRETFRQMADTNVASHAIVTDKFTPLLKASNFAQKRVVFVSSGLGSLTKSSDPTHTYFATYCLEYRTTKAGVNIAAVYFANILKDSGIAVAVACPGWCKNSGGPLDTEVGAAQIAKVATEGENEDVAGKWFDPDGQVPW